jgi:hypothetical protein
MSTNAPPCATCGQPLRWIAESYGWGCDRCRQFHPAGQAQAATPAPSAQQPAQPAPQTAPGAYGQQYAAAAAPVAASAGGKSKKGLFIALGGVALVGGIIAIVLVARGGGGGGGGSRDGTIKKVFANLSTGDVDGLIALAPDAAAFEKFEDCDKDAKKKRKRSSDDDDDDEDDPAKRKKAMEKKIRKEVEKLVKKAKKAKFEIEEIVTKEPKAMTAEERECDDEDEDGEKKRKKKSRDKDKDEDDDVKVMVIARKGCKTRPGCKATVDVRMQRIDVKVKITPDKEGAKTKTKKVAVNLIEVDGGWYVEDVKLPDLGGGGDDDDAGGGDDDEGKDAMWTAMERYADNVCACKDMDCVTKVGEDWAKKAAELAKTSSGKAGEMTAKDKKRSEEVVKKITECTKKITDEAMKKAEPPKPADPPDEPDDSTSGGGGVPSGVVLSDAPSDMTASCKLYRTAIEKAMRCPAGKVDAKMKSMFADGWNAFVKSWGMITDASMKATVGSSCDKMVEAMERTVAAMCR